MKTLLLGGRRSEKLLNFHHLQMMKKHGMGGSPSNISLKCHSFDFHSLSRGEGGKVNDTNFTLYTVFFGMSSLTIYLLF